MAKTQAANFPLFLFCPLKSACLLFKEKANDVKVHAESSLSIFFLYEEECNHVNKGRVKAKGT
jgi:hypothetical protein